MATKPDYSKLSPEVRALLEEDCCKDNDKDQSFFARPGTAILLAYGAFVLTAVSVVLWFKLRKRKDNKDKKEQDK